MVKRVMAESKEHAEEIKKIAEEPLPTLTFTEAEVQKVANFINYVYLNAEFKSGMKGFKDLNQMFADMHTHMGKIEKHIFEFKKVRAAKEATGKTE
jgi:uncharacterized membrane protein